MSRFTTIITTAVLEGKVFCLLRDGKIVEKSMDWYMHADEHDPLLDRVLFTREQAERVRDLSWRN